MKTEIFFAKKSYDLNEYWDGEWHASYGFKKKLKKAKYLPKLIIKSDSNQIEDIRIHFEGERFSVLLTPHYNWINLNFWIDIGLYPPFKTGRMWEHPVVSGSFPRICNEFEKIFTDVWRICVNFEGKAEISNMKFLDYIWLVIYLLESSLVHPIKEEYPRWVALNKRHASVKAVDIWQIISSNYVNTASDVFDGYGIDFFNYCKGMDYSLDNTPKELTDVFYSDVCKILTMSYKDLKRGGGHEKFLLYIFDSFLDELIKKKYIERCQACEGFFPYQKKKSYCSEKCRRQFNNQKYYDKNKKKISTRMRKEMRETRAFYKKFNVKKAL